MPKDCAYGIYWVAATLWLRDLACCEEPVDITRRTYRRYFSYWDRKAAKGTILRFKSASKQGEEYDRYIIPSYLFPTFSKAKYYQEIYKEIPHINRDVPVTDIIRSCGLRALKLRGAYYFPFDEPDDTKFYQ